MAKRKLDRMDPQTVTVAPETDPKYTHETWIDLFEKNPRFMKHLDRAAEISGVDRGMLASVFAGETGQSFRDPGLYMSEDELAEYEKRPEYAWGSDETIPPEMWDQDIIEGRALDEYRSRWAYPSQEAGGTDTFGDDEAELRRLGLLGEDFKTGQNYVYEEGTNESGEPGLVGARYRSIDDAIKASAAVMGMHYMKVGDEMRKAGLNPTREDLEHFGYARYNMGPEGYKKYLQQAVDQGWLENQDYLTKEPESNKYHKIYDNIRHKMDTRDRGRERGVW